VVGLGRFSFVGRAGVASVLDDFLIGFENPLFPDADLDGMDDGWETAHGLAPAVDDRAGDPDGDGLTNIREFMHQLRPDRISTFDDGIADGLRVSLGLSLTEPTRDRVPPTAPRSWWLPPWWLANSRFPAGNE